MNTSSPTRLALSIGLSALLSGCATGPGSNPADPLEPLNRATFRFNDALDRNVAQPVARGYNKVTPRPLKIMITNFFANLADIPSALNSFLQGRGAEGMEGLMRIALNTTFGIGGVLDIATPAGLPRRDQDFGLTLGHWGVGPGPFLVLPVFGPSTVRDAFGFGVDQYANVVNYQDVALRNSLWGLNFVNTRARYLDATRLLEEAALDKYSFVRDAYLGRRRSLVSEGRGESTLPSYGEPAAAPEASGTPAPIR